MRRTRSIFPGLWLAAAVMCWVALMPVIAAAEEEEPEAEGVATSETQAQVRVLIVREGTLPVKLRALGRIGSTRQFPAAVAAQAAGIVSGIEVQDGGQVSSGTVLLRLDARLAQAALVKAQSDLELARQELEYTRSSGLTQQQEELDLAAHQARVKAGQAQRDAERMSELLAKKLVSDKAATEARQAAETGQREAEAAERKAALYRKTGKGLDVERLRAKVVEAQAALRLAEIEAEAMIVRAPLAGRVTRIHVVIGQSVEKGASLLELEARQGIGAAFDLSPAQARRVRPAMAFTLHETQTTQTFQGKILTVGAGVDPESGLVRVEGVLSLARDAAPPYMGEVLPGEIVVGQSPRGVIVPVSAVSATEEGRFVHRIDEDHKAHPAAVKVLVETDGFAVVQGDGLKAGQTIVTDGNYNLPEGAGVVEEKADHE